MGVVHQGGQGHRGAGGTGPHQGRPEHDAQVTGTHLVVLLQLRYPRMGTGDYKMRNLFVFVCLSKIKMTSHIINITANKLLSTAIVFHLAVPSLSTRTLAVQTIKKEEEPSSAINKNTEENGQ